ncbi:FUSC family protein [Mesorhizobium sp. VK22B]|uniref:FUSC family protein n=1 Tax=Mesorhizobium captivum TaxID=3072319 RepID=A0ABU4Z9X4_9HYPH|nr:FUSC family protein [Mesorhizobium sp. VK22B]MDX8494752.1 FUSC family protein [Mesorhizobium sp. VK22B]
MTLPKQVRFCPLGFPFTSWAFAIRIWPAAIVALYVSLWFSLEGPSTALKTVAVVAEPTRGQALENAVFRVLATIIGVAASIATALFSQKRDLLLIAYAGWMDLCVYIAGLADGNRAYAAVLSGVTVGLVAIQEIDNREHVFESGMMRDAGILIGIASGTIVNDLAGLVEFVVLDGVNAFTLLAIGLVPLVIGAALLISLPTHGVGSRSIHAHVRRDNILAVRSANL